MGILDLFRSKPEPTATRNTPAVMADGAGVAFYGLSDPALIAYWSSRFAGADDAGKTPILEEGLEYKAIGANAKDSQSHETRGAQIEEIARIFGVPRPLLMVDETSWGSGIDVLGQFFVQYALNPWFEAWQQAIERSLLTDQEAETLEVKFNAGALLRGSMEDQASYFAAALGAGGTQAFDEPARARDQDVNKLRAMELRLMRGGESRTEARAHVNEIRGTTDSAPAAGTTDSAGKDDWSGLTSLLATLRS